MSIKRSVFGGFGEDVSIRQHLAPCVVRCKKKISFSFRGIYLQRIIVRRSIAASLVDIRISLVRPQEIDSNIGIGDLSSKRNGVNVLSPGQMAAQISHARDFHK